ncbi:MAG: leucine-rich repeat domain-containing protein, partial [Paludibacteraceae bacterium]|nr:leucine-rich repeat domain-containing protein [Paludibacteraceae bacterium]
MAKNRFIIPSIILVLFLISTVCAINSKKHGGKIYTREGSALIINEGVKEISEFNFNFSHKEAIKSVVLPDSMERIGYLAFQGFSGLTSITIPEGVTSIDEQAFYDCHNLSSVQLPSTLRSIGEGAFFRCEKLNSITIPDSVISIDASAFSSTQINQLVVYDNGQKCA